MAEIRTYCMKRCENCNYRERLQCLGCHEGPGKPLSGDCKLAKCCREKGHETCNTCVLKLSCAIFKGRSNIPGDRLKMQADKEEERQLLAQKSEFIGRLMQILFWLCIPLAVAGVLTNESVIDKFGFLYLSGQIINILCLLAYGIVLIKLSAEYIKYKTAAVCEFITCVVSVILLFRGTESSTALVLGGISAIVSLIGEYNEYMSHAYILKDIDLVMSDNWEKLWKWFIGMFLALIAGFIVMAVIPFIGIIILIIAAVGTLIVSILKLVYLYRTAKIFREYSLNPI